MIEMKTCELWEVDVVLQKKLKKVDDIQDIDVALAKAKKLAEAWCVDEKPKVTDFKNGNYLVIGESDFGILILNTEKK